MSESWISHFLSVSVPVPVSVSMSVSGSVAARDISDRPGAADTLGAAVLAVNQAAPVPVSDSQLPGRQAPRRPRRRRGRTSDSLRPVLGWSYKDS